METLDWASLFRTEERSKQNIRLWESQCEASAKPCVGQKKTTREVTLFKEELSGFYIMDSIKKGLHAAIIASCICSKIKPSSSSWLFPVGQRCVMIWLCLAEQTLEDNKRINGYMKQKAAFWSTIEREAVCFGWFEWAQCFWLRASLCTVASSHVCKCKACFVGLPAVWFWELSANQIGNSSLQ